MFNKRPTLPVPLARWQKDLTAIDELREIVSSETYRVAIATLKETSLLTGETIMQADKLTVNRANWLAGYYDAFRDIERLTKLTDTKTQANLNEWTHIQNNPQM